MEPPCSSERNSPNRLLPIVELLESRLGRFVVEPPCLSERNSPNPPFGKVELLERMRTGRFKVVDTPANREFLAEKHLLHRKDGLIVARNDDIESALRYASMMLRYAVSDVEGGTMSRRPRFDRIAAEYDPLAAFSSRR